MVGPGGAASGAAPGDVGTPWTPATCPPPGGSSGAVLTDFLGTWLTGLVDRAEAWEELDRAAAVVQEHTTALCAALSARTGDIVLVTNEVGMTLVPQTASGR